MLHQNKKVKFVENGNSVKMAVFQSRKVEMMEQIGEKEKFVNGLRKEVHGKMKIINFCYCFKERLAFFLI